MPYPIPSGEEIYVELKERSSFYEMKTFETYTDFYGISLIVTGDRKFITPTMIAQINAGDIGFTTKHLSHRATFLSDVPYSRYLVKFKETAISHMLQEVHLNCIDELLPYPVYHFNETDKKYLKDLLAQMLLEYTQKKKYYQPMLIQLLNQLILFVARNHIEKYPTDMILSNVSDIILDAIYYIDTHYDKNISLKEVSKTLGISESHFSRLFKKETGITYSAYFQSVKLSHAEQLLINSKKTVEEIAYITGFADSSYLCHVFKEKYGLTPNAYRKRHYFSVGT
jgi:AraC-like DNA-binding protein